GDHFLGPAEGAGDDRILDPEVDQTQVPQLHGDVAHAGAWPVRTGDQLLDRDVEGPRDPNELVVCRPSRSQLELNHHRLEAGGFASRLQARLILSPNRIRPPQASAYATTQGLRGPIPLPRRVRRTGSDRLEGEGF